MKRFFVVFLVFTISVLGANAKELLVDKIGSGQLRKIGFMSKQDAFKEFAGYTFTLKRSKSKANRSLRAFPFHGTVVVYFAPNQRVYAWAKGETKVQTGTWGIGTAADKSSKSGNLLCFNFSKAGKEYGLCPVIKRYGKYIHERTKGNPFKLRKGGKVPKVVKKHNRSLKKTLASL